MSAVKIGLLGGSFDPIHFGHLVAAQDVYEQFSLDRVILIPAAQAPLKNKEVQASPEDRLALVQAAVDGDPRFSVSDFEIREGGVNYTIDTVRHFRGLHPSDELFWIIGADQVAQLPRWREIEQLAALITFIFVERPGFPTDAPPAVRGLVLKRCNGHLVELSSTELRQRLRDGRSVDYFVPHKAIVTLREKRLYR